MGTFFEKSALSIALVTLILCAGMPSPAAAGTSDESCKGYSPDSMLEQIQDFDLELRKALISVNQHAMAGRFDAAKANSLLNETEIYFDRIYQIVETCGRGEADQLKRKLAALRGRLQNLQIASANKGAASRIGVLDFPPKEHRPWVTKTAPQNDDCVNAADLGFDIATGNTMAATRDGEANCGGSRRTRDVWYRFVAADSKRVYVDTEGSDFDTVISVHRNCPGDLSNEIACNDDAFGLQSSVGFFASSGEDYLVRVSGVNGAAGDYRLRISEGSEIVGIVSSGEDGSPVAGVEVYLYKGEQDSNWNQTTFTSADGQYGFASLPSDVWRVWTGNAHPYVNESYGGAQCLPFIPCFHCTRCECDIRTGAVITTEVDAPPAVADIEIDVGATVTGAVTDNIGSPTGEVTVDIFEQNESCVAGTTETSVSGTWSISGLPTGSYKATAAKFGLIDELFDDVSCEDGIPDGCSLTDGVAISVTVSETTPGIDFSLDLSPVIEGEVVSAADGHPISAQIKILHLDGSYAGTASSNSSGIYRWGGSGSDGAPPGQYYVAVEEFGHNAKLFDDIDCQSSHYYHCDVSKGTIVAVDRGSPASGINFAIDESATIEGTVSYPDGIAQGVEVKLWNDLGAFRATAITNYLGKYNFSYLKSGTYYVATDLNRENDQLFPGIPCPMGVPFGCEVAEGSPIEVDVGATIDGIDFVLDEPSITGFFSISGTVTSAIDGSTPPTTVTAYDVGGSEVLYGHPDEFGFYHLEDLPSGSYIVEAEPSSSVEVPLEVQLFNGVDCGSGWDSGGCSFMDAEPVVMTPGAPARHINFSLGPADGIHVSVTDKVLGVPVTNARVSLWSSEGFDRTYNVNSEGKANFDRLEPGTYYLTAIEQDYFDYLYAEILCTGGPGIGCLPQEGTPIVVSEGAGITSVHIELDPGVSIEGTVTSARDTSPVTAVNTLWGEDGKVISNSSLPGHFSFRGLSVGTYYLSTTGKGRFRDELYPDIPCPGGPPGGCSLEDGQPIVIEDSGVYPGFDFVLDLLGSITGMAFDLDTGISIPAYAQLLDGSGTQVGVDDAYDRAFEFVGLEPGNYHLQVLSEGYDSVLYDGIPCPGGVGVGCSLAQGTPISVEYNSAPIEVEARLRPSPGTISGTVVDKHTGEPIPGCEITLGQLDGGFGYSDARSDHNGRYLISDVVQGEYLLAVTYASRHIEEVYDGMPCPRTYSNPPWACDRSKGAHVVVPPDGGVTGIDFALEADFQGLRGLVVDDESGQPMVDVYIDVWDANSHAPVASMATNFWGRFAAELEVGSYLVSTDAGADHIDQVFFRFECPAGPAFLGLCELDPGISVEVLDGELRSEIDFVLRRVLIMEDGFETGDLSNWIVAPD